MPTAPPAPSAPSAGPPNWFVAPERPLGTRLDPADQWKPWTAFVALVVAIAAALFLSIIVAAVGAAAGAPVSHATPAENLISTFLQDGCFIGAVLWMASRVAFPLPDQFGLRATRAGRAVAIVAGSYVLFLIITAVWTKLLNIHEVDKLTDTLGANESTIALIAVCALTCVVAPIAEEMLFRGYMFRALRNWHGVWPAALIVGLIFGGVHVASAPVGFLLPLAAFGVILCLVYQVTRSLYPGIALHCVNNSIAIASVEHFRFGSGVALIVAALVTIAALARFVVPWWATLGRPRPAL